VNDSDLAVSIVRKLVRAGYRSGMFSTELGVVDISMLDFTDDEAAYIDRLMDEAEDEDNA
jgi:hypothetical protein